MKQSIRSIVLAAGKSTRLQTGRTKLIEKICGQEMILYTTKLLEKMEIPTTLVVGYDKERVINTVISHHDDYFTFIEQTEQLGTGHAVAATKDAWNAEHILVINGDLPLLTSEIISQLYQEHVANDASISIVVSYFDEPNHPYGRVVMDDGKVSIVEARDLDLNDPLQEYPWINAGVYLINTVFLQESISKLTINNAQKEFYITDLINIATEERKKIMTVQAPFDDIRGVNTFEELCEVEQIKQRQLIAYWIEKGVRFSAAQNIHIDMQVTIGEGSYVGCGVHLRGETTVGKNTAIHEYCSVQDSTIGNYVQVYSHSIIANAVIDDESRVGPFSHVRDNKPKEQEASHAHTHITQKSGVKSSSGMMEIKTESKKKCNLTNKKKTKTKKSGSLFMGARMLQEDFAFHED